MRPSFLRRQFLLAAVASAALAACGGGGGGDDTTFSLPAAPQGAGQADSAPVADETTTLPFVDYAYTNQRGDARYATKETNAGVRVVAGFLALWQPRSPFVDAGVSAPANGSFAAVTTTDWSGIPGSATDGTVLNAAVHAANIQYVVDATAHRTPAQELAAYVDDRRGKGYSVTDGLGPLTAAWRTAAQQTTTITGIPADATTVKYDDAGNNVGVGASGNPSFGTVVDFVGTHGPASTEPAKRFFKYARPWRWTSDVVVAPSLVPAKSTTAVTDGGFISGHAAEATRDALLMAYVLPERFQELITRALELGENRILAGMHSPLDVIGGRVQAQAVIAAQLHAQATQTTTDPATGGMVAVADQRKAAYDQAHTALMAASGTGDMQAFNAYAHSAPASNDRFADHATNKANYRRWLTYGFSPIADTTRPAVVPKGAELLLETRLPYLDAAQRRVVLKTTALPSGYPVLDDAEGWGRLNLFDAADGYGAFDGDVTVTMDAALGGFHALDTWQNDIAGAGKLTKQGSGALRLSGHNGYTGGTQLVAGTLQAESATAFGLGDVYVAGGSLVCRAAAPLQLTGAYTQLAGATLELNLGDAGAGRLSVGGTATLAGGTLHVTLRSGFAPVVGDVLAVITSAKLSGKFDTIGVDGHKVTPTYTPTGLQLRIDS